MSEKGSSVQWENCVLPSAVRRGRVYNPCIMRIPSQVNSGRAATHTHQLACQRSSSQVVSQSAVAKRTETLRVHSFTDVPMALAHATTSWLQLAVPVLIEQTLL